MIFLACPVFVRPVFVFSEGRREMVAWSEEIDGACSQPPGQQARNKHGHSTGQGRKEAYRKDRAAHQPPADG